MGLASDLRKKLHEQKYKCALTGWPLEPDSFEFDHIVPVSRGGTDTADNLIAVHPVVNRAKHTMSYTDFVEMCKAVAVNASYPLPPSNDLLS